MTDNAIYSKISVYLSDIDNVDKYSQKIKLAENLFYFLTGDEEVINLLKSNDRFFNICLIKLPELLYSNIEKDKYNNLYNKLLEIGNADKVLLIGKYNNKGNQINSLHI